MNKKLYYHKTDGGAEYLCLQPIEGGGDGDLFTAVVRLDGEPELLKEITAPSRRIVRAISKWVEEGCSNTYIEACAWSMRDSNTSMDDIVFTIGILRDANRH